MRSDPHTADVLLSKFMKILESQCLPDVLSPRDFYILAQDQCTAILNDHENGDATLPVAALAKARNVLAQIRERLDPIDMPHQRSGARRYRQ